MIGVNLIGGQGLDAVSNAQQVYAASLLAAATPEPVITPTLKAMMSRSTNRILMYR